MKLEDFVKETLVQIATGVNNAKKSVEEAGGIVNPQGVGFIGGQGIGRLFDANTNQPVQEIDFDVAITVSEGNEKGGGISIAVGPIHLGAGTKKENDNIVVNRIQFKVPLILPNTVK